MSASHREKARSEIDQSIKLSTFSMARFGLTYTKPSTTSAFIKQKVMFLLSFFGIFYHIISDIIFIAVTIVKNPRVEFVVPLLHTFGYGALSTYTRKVTINKLYEEFFERSIINYNFISI